MRNYKIALKQAYSTYESQLEQSRLPYLEEIIIKLSLLFEERTLQQQNGIRGIFSEAISIRFISECFAIIACLKGGAFYPSFHHIRDLLETVAIFHFVYEKFNTGEEKWLKRFVEFQDIFRYKELKKCTHYKTKIPQEEFQSLESKEKYWLDLFNEKSIEDIRKKWTNKLPIVDTLDVLTKGLIEWEKSLLQKNNISQEDTDRTSLEPINFREMYDDYCHYTHFSQLFLRKTNEKMIGLPEDINDIDNLLIHVDAAIEAFFFVIDKFKKLEVFKISNMKEYETFRVRLRKHLEP